MPVWFTLFAAQGAGQFAHALASRGFAAKNGPAAGKILPPGNHGFCRSDTEPIEKAEYYFQNHLARHLKRHTPDVREKTRDVEDAAKCGAPTSREYWRPCRWTF